MWLRRTLKDEFDECWVWLVGKQCMAGGQLGHAYLQVDPFLPAVIATNSESGCASHLRYVKGSPGYLKVNSPRNNLKLSLPLSTVGCFLLPVRFCRISPGLLAVYFPGT